MNITKALCVAAACALLSIAGCTGGQGPANTAGIQRIENKTTFDLIVTHGTEKHSLTPGQSIDLEINSQNITTAPFNGTGTINQVIQKYNPGRCSVAQCTEFH